MLSKQSFSGLILLEVVMVAEVLQSSNNRPRPHQVISSHLPLNNHHQIKYSLKGQQQSSQVLKYHRQAVKVVAEKALLLISRGINLSHKQMN
jgi:hypothetical protein